MAEDREAFRDLLDRIDQPYAPSCDRRGRDAGRARRVGRRGPRPRSACRPSSGPRSRSAGPAAGSSRPRPPYRERVRAGLRASPIGQVMVEQLPRRLAGDRVRGHARRRRHVHRRVLDGERRPARGPHRRLDRRRAGPDADRRGPPALRSAALAIIRALGVEGGCNVQFALSPDSTEYAVIEVNPRVSRSSALASKATGYPIARVAAQIAVGRRLAEIPNVVTGTTVAAFEPALDYVVVKLPRFPFDKFPSADRTLGSQMKATGEVMAIDRTFGSALNKALRGLEQAGVGPLAEDPSWAPTLDYLAGVLRRRPATTTSRSAGSTRRARRASRPATPSGPPRRSCCAGSSRRPTRGCGGCSACSAAACRRRSSARRPASRPGSSPRWAGTSRLEAEVAAIGRARSADPRTRRPPSSSPRSSGPGSATGSWPDWPARPRDAIRAARLALGLGPGYAMVDTCAAEFAAETPYFYSTYAAAGSAPEAPPVARPGRARHRLAGRSASARASSSTTAPSRRPTRCAARAGRR